MKNRLLLTLLLGLCGVLFSSPNLLGQDSSYQLFRAYPERYAVSLATLFANMKSELGITIVYDKKFEPLLEKKVPMAPWKYWSDPAIRLAYILAPLDLSFEKVDEQTYRVFEPWYYIRPEQEGQLHLERLLKQFPDRASWENRRVALRENILQTMNLAPLPKKTPLNPIYAEKKVFDGYTAQSVALEIIPKYYLFGTLYRPIKEERAYPLVLFPHGHGKTGRFSESSQFGAATLARMGAVTFAYSMFAWIEEESPLKASDHRDPIAGTMQTLGTIRVLDFMTSLDNVDTSHIGITGASGGGTQTFIGTAVDDRITVSVPVVMVSTHFFGGCPCESGLPFHLFCGGTNNAEIAACAAPRPMLLIGVTQDWTKNIPQVEFPYIQKIYEFFGAKDNLEYAYFDEPHGYSESMRKVMYLFMAKHLGLDATQADESKVTLDEMENMLVFGKKLEHYPKEAVQNLDEVKQAFEASKK